MARNKALERAKVSVPSGRSPFDLSQESSITSLCGEIDVPYWQPVVKGTKGSINRSVFTRTADIVSPAFHRVTEHFDFFLVPIHSLWRSWENWKLNINDLQDTNLVKWNDVVNTPNLSLPNNCPRMDFSRFIPALYDPLESTADASQVRKMNDCLRFCDWFQYAPKKVLSSDSPLMYNLFGAAAYQKCYFEHYRNTAYESNNPYAYNFDWLYPNDDGLVQLISSKPKHLAVAKEWFKVRRVNMRNDYFHNIYPALNYVASSPNGGNFSVPSNLADISFGGINQVGFFNEVVTGASQTPSVRTLWDGGNSPAINVQTIRAMFALDKLLRASAYAPKHVKEQYKAQFGVDGKVYDEDMRSQRIGSFQSVVAFQEVTQMATTEGGLLGDLGAKGLGRGDADKPINFYAEYDSILICMHYFLPRSRYDNDGIFEWNTHISRESFFVKAFENLGLRPFYIRNLNGSLVTTFAWTVPNFEYKLKPDLNHNEFKESFDTYTYDPDEEAGSRIMIQTDLQDQLSCFVPHTLNHFPLTVEGYTADYFKVAPEDLDNIFKDQVPADHRIGFYQFYSDYRISVPVVAPMSVHGQPGI